MKYVNGFVFSVLTLLFGRQKWHAAHKTWITLNNASD